MESQKKINSSSKKAKQVYTDRVENLESRTFVNTTIESDNEEETRTFVKRKGK